MLDRVASLPGAPWLYAQGTRLGGIAFYPVTVIHFNVVDESQAENRFVPMQEAEIRCEILPKQSHGNQRVKQVQLELLSTRRRSQGNWTWTPDTVEALLKYTKQRMQLKTKCEFSGLDFEADLQSFYTEVRRCIAIDNSEDFGLQVVTSTILKRACCVEQFSRKP